MTTDSHVKGSERSHNQMKKNAKAVGMRKRSDEEFEKALTEVQAQLNVLMELLQQDAEDQRRGWLLRKEVKWHKLQVKLKHRLSIQQREKELKVAEMDVCICEPEQ